MKKTLIVILALVMVLAISSAAFAGVDSNGWFTTRGDAPIPLFGPPNDPAVQYYWNIRHTVEQHEALFKYLQATYPNNVKLYPIGHTWEERTIWCLEISSNGKSDGKTPLAIVSNIHGGEQESAECASYTAWWLASGFAANDPAAIKALDGYVWYIIPIMNVDGYVRSMYSNTRPNMRPRGVGRDEYFDRNGDGKVGQMFAGASATSPPYNGTSSVTTSRYAKDYTAPQNTTDGYNYLGYEAYDTNNDGIFGNDTKASNIDLNRSFDHFWTLYRPANASSQADGYYALGASGTWNDNVNTRNAGPGPASEPEVQAIQNFFSFVPPRAMITGHTGIQCVLYPWCYTRDRAPDYAHMSATAEKMRAAFQTTTTSVRPRARYYQMQSYFDYPTSSEMIDWLYGRLGTHAYTVEVYAGGTGNNTSTNWDDTTWWNTNFPFRWAYLGAVRDHQSGAAQRSYDNVWIYYSTTQIRRGEAPPDQYIMGEGFKDCALAMAESEPKNSPHPGAPGWMTGQYGKTINITDIIPEDPFKYNYTLYLKATQAAITASDTLYVDVMLYGDINYTQVTAEITFDTGLLEYAGHESLSGWAASCTLGANRVALRSVPSMNMTVGLPCDPAEKIVTLKFKVKAGFSGAGVPTDLAFSSLSVSPPGGYTKATTAPGQPLTISISE